jgi:hypothetical protein
VYFADELSRKFRTRRRAFSLCSVLVALVGFFIFGVINPERDAELGLPEFGLLIAVVAIIYVLKRIFWRCPSCGSSLQMGGLTVFDLKRSDKVRCPGCGVTLE